MKSSLYLSVKDSLTGACGTYVYQSDANFDRQFDEKDTFADKDLRLFCLTSKASFSCGNLVPCIFKQNGDIALMGTAPEEVPVVLHRSQQRMAMSFVPPATSS